MQQVLALPEIRKASFIHCYWPIAEKREFDTINLIKELTDRGKHIVLPVVLSFKESASEPRMDHRIYDGETNLKKNRWGVLEPITKKSFSISDLEAIIVPALGVDKNGFRLGYGKGFYDAFLVQCNCPLICPIYGKGLLDNIPTMSHDIPVDIIVTEQEVIRVKH